jgi:chromate reductase
MTMNVLGMAGSLRQESVNRRLLDALARRAPKSVRFETFDALPQVPLFNEDLESPMAPQGVRRLWQAVRDANVLVIATPEYNQSLPGVVKNAVDWLSRDPDGSPLRAKLCAVTGATIGRWGTRIAQQQLKTALMTCGARVLSGPALFHADGLTADPGDSALDDYWNALVAEWGMLAAAA